MAPLGDSRRQCQGLRRRPELVRHSAEHVHRQAVSRLRPSPEPKRRGEHARARSPWPSSVALRTRQCRRAARPDAAAAPLAGAAAGRRHHDGMCDPRPHAGTAPGRRRRRSTPRRPSAHEDAPSAPGGARGRRCARGPRPPRPRIARAIGSMTASAGYKSSSTLAPSLTSLLSTRTSIRVSSGTAPRAGPLDHARHPHAFRTYARSST